MKANRLKIVLGKDMTEPKKEAFDWVIRAAFKKETLSVADLFSPENVHFFLHDDNDAIVAVGRYVKVEGITCGDEVWDKPVWGRSFVAVLPQHWGNGYGKKIVQAMVAYANEREWSHVGIHGKTAHVAKGETGKSLSAFYRECGLIVDEKLGEKLEVGKQHKTLAHTNISYTDGNPFIAWVNRQAKRVNLPFSW